jgi:hypothetical protein
MVIVKSKLTGKFLRQHSDSANNFNRRCRWKIQKAQKGKLPPYPSGPWDDPKLQKQRDKHNLALAKLVHAEMYNAEALEARRYASPGMALSSIGKWIGGGLSPEAREARGISSKKHQHVLPEHLEIHEIVAGNLCLVGSDDDEDEKRKKMEDCK